jgi:hypothetical protein
MTTTTNLFRSFTDRDGCSTLYKGREIEVVTTAGETIIAEFVDHNAREINLRIPIPGKWSKQYTIRLIDIAEINEL